MYGYVVMLVYATYPDEFPDSEFFGYNPTGYANHEGEEVPPRLHPITPTPPIPAETASGSGVRPRHAVARN
jgi:hypothetical protein